MLVFKWLVVASSLALIGACSSDRMAQISQSSEATPSRNHFKPVIHRIKKVQRITLNGAMRVTVGPKSNTTIEGSIFTFLMATVENLNLSPLLTLPSSFSLGLGVYKHPNGSHETAPIPGRCSLVSQSYQVEYSHILNIYLAGVDRNGSQNCKHFFDDVVKGGLNVTFNHVALPDGEGFAEHVDLVLYPF